MNKLSNSMKMSGEWMKANPIVSFFVLALMLMYSVCFPVYIISCGKILFWQFLFCKSHNLPPTNQNSLHFSVQLASWISHS